MSGDANAGEKRGSKQQRKMTKILAKAWNAAGAEPFQESSSSSNSTRKPSDLSSIGQALDGGAYRNSRSGWEEFARALGQVYGYHITDGNHAGLAKEHFNEVKRQLSKIDPQLAEIANDSVPSPSASSAIPKKRKASASSSDGGNTSIPTSAVHVPKKKRHGDSKVNGTTTTSYQPNENLTITQREQRGMEALANYLEDCGGAQEQANNFRCKVTRAATGDRYHVAYVSSQGRRLRSMAEVARFVGLDPDTKPTAASSQKRSSGSTSPYSQSATLTALISTKRPRNNRECEAEKKRLRKELEKLVKNHAKATKSLDEFRNDHKDDGYPVDDEVLMEEEDEEDEDEDHVSSSPSANNDRKRQIQLSNRGVLKSKIFQNAPPDMENFPGIPADCTSDVLMVWDFLCTFGRALSLDPIKLDDFAAALIFKPEGPDANNNEEGGRRIASSGPPASPLYLAEAHLALLVLLLSDPTSDEWWWSTLETEEPIGDGITDEIGINAEHGGGKKKGDSDEQQLTPVIKVDMEELLAIQEEPQVTTRWLQALEDVRTRKTNAGGPIKSAVKSAISITTNNFVSNYLRKSLKKWKGNSAGFTKRAVVWLVDKVREARPDLWGRKVSQEEVDEQSKKVATEAAIVMEQFTEDPELEQVGNGEEDEGDDSDDMSESEEEESDENDEDYQEDGNGKNDEVKKENSVAAPSRGLGSGPADDKLLDMSRPVTSTIPVKPPPTLVDLLLPPRKPLPASDLISPFTWPSLAGAATCRILHRYKRKRNEVDDSLREFRELSPLTVGERRKREAMAPHRILTECASFLQNENPTEDAIDHLCEGKPYMDMSPIQKLCVLRLLVEAAYDTQRIHKCVEDNIKARNNAVKALDSEERRAKREAKEEAAAAEGAARTRLAEETLRAFLLKKRREIARNNKYTNQFTQEYIDGLTDDSIIGFDDETKAEYESLPSADDFNKGEVAAMVSKIQEESAFETNSLLVLSLEEIEARESAELDSLKERLTSYGCVNGAVHEHTDRDTSAKIERVKNEIADLEQSRSSLPASRSEALEALKDAIEDGTMKALRSAIKTAKMAMLTGPLDDNDDGSSGGVWALDLLRDAALELKNVESRKRVTEAQRDLVAKRNRCFVRTMPVGMDRFRSKFWHFDYDESGRIWFEADWPLRLDDEDDTAESKTTKEDKGPLAVKLMIPQTASIGATDMEADILSQALSNSDGIDREIFLRFSRQEYHGLGLVSALVKRYCGCHASERSLRQILKYLDGRGIRESSLKSKLKEMLEAGGIANTDGNDMERNGSSGGTNNVGMPSDHHDYKANGDENVFRQATSSISLEDSNTQSQEDLNLLENIASAIGHRVRLRKVLDPESSSATNTPPTALYEMGTVTGWRMKKSYNKPQSEPQSSSSAENESKPVLIKEPVWCVTKDKGGENETLAANELIRALIRCIKWSSQMDGYIEDDSTLFEYRNNLGRFCGRAADSPYASNPIFFARWMLRREQEFYMPLKSRTYENNWGGKSGARNAWIASMKEHGDDFEAVRDGLLTLEAAFFEFCSGETGEGNMSSSSPFGVPSEVDGRSGWDLLNDEEYRFDIELESITQNITSLWNSPQARIIYREIMSSGKSIGFLALGLDLLCRNCQAYLDATRPTVMRHGYEPHAGGRRMNAWQQSHSGSF